MQASEPVNPTGLFGVNLLKNGGFETFENNSAPGWSFQINGKNAAVSADQKSALSGAQSLKISLPESGSSCQVVSTPVLVTPGKSYLFSISFRQEGMSSMKNGTYAFSGVEGSASLEWLDEKEKAITGSAPLQFPYAPSPWDIRDAIVVAPATAKSVIVQVSFGNESAKQVAANIPSCLWLDEVHLREYTPPPTPAWATQKAGLVVDGFVSDTEVKTFFPASDTTWRYINGQWSKSITDGKTERGGALKAEACGSVGIMANSPYYQAMPPGLYRMIARVAVPDISSPEKSGFIDIDSQNAGERAMLEIVPRDFPVSGEYRNVERDFLVRDDGWWSLRAYTDGKQEWRIDSIRVFPLTTFSDVQLIEVFPGCDGAVPADLKPVRKPVLKALVVAGVGWDTLKIPEILRSTFMDMEMTPVWLQKDSGYKLKSWPETPEALFQNNAVFLCNIPSTAFSIQQKSTLREYVRRGGILVIMGGHLSYERGAWKGSLLDELLPVEVADTFGQGLLLNKTGWPIELSPKIPWVGDYSLDERPEVYALHRSIAKPDTEILASADGFPFLCARKYGEGKVIACLGAPLGMADGNSGVPFWQWNDWIYLMRDTLYDALAPEKLTKLNE